MIILLLGGELRHKEAQRWARVQPADAGGRDFHLQFTFQAPASDHRAPRPLDPGQARSRGRSPTSPPHPQAFPLALPPSTASSPAQRPSLQECTLVIRVGWNSSPVLLPRGGETDILCPPHLLTLSPAPWPVSTSSREPPRAGPRLPLGLSFSKARQGLWESLP